MKKVMNNNLNELTTINSETSEKKQFLWKNQEIESKLDFEDINNTKYWQK